LHASLKGTLRVPYFCARYTVFEYTLILIIQELRLGFVKYGARGDRVPVFKRFFSVGAHNELKDIPAVPFIGHTSSGGSEGMAALDGYAAAIEVKIYFVCFSICTHNVLVLARCLTDSGLTSTRSIRSSLVTYGTLQPGDLTMLITHI
jgi:hypothetical protein